MPDAARDHIVSLVCDNSEGMFLYARLVLENLYKQKNLEDVYKELQEDTFPHGFDQAYARIVKRILGNQDTVQQQTARQLLGRISCAKRPLKWQEIQGACAIDVKKGQVNFKTRQLADEIRDICGSLVEIVAGSRIRLVHVTARKYLVQKGEVDVAKEDFKLGLLSLRYLTFPCFDLDASQKQTVEFVKDGSYTFLEYASLHWNYHLEDSVDSLKPEDLLHSTELGMALNEFYEIYNPEPIRSEKHKKELDKIEKDCTHKLQSLQEADCYQPLKLLLTNTKASRLVEEQLEALGPVGSIIKKVRVTFEELNASQTISQTEKQKLKELYGENWYKCSRHACYYFHEGFSKERDLSQHTNKHDTPYCCTEMGCTRMYIGWSTEKELKKHMNQFHPDPDAFAWKFPHVKKPPSMFLCDSCPKQFTRANILKTHKIREHRNERPFNCTICGKGFVRQYECGRHEKTHAKAPGESQSSVEAVGN